MLIADKMVDQNDGEGTNDAKFVMQRILFAKSKVPLKLMRPGQKLKILRLKKGHWEHIKTVTKNDPG